LYIIFICKMIRFIYTLFILKISFNNDFYECGSRICKILTKVNHRVSCWSNSQVIWMLSLKMKIKIVKCFDKTTSKLNEIGSSLSNAATSRQSKQPSIEDIERMSIESRISCEIGEFLFDVDSNAQYEK